MSGRGTSKRRAGIGPRRVARAKTRHFVRRPRFWLDGLIAASLVPIFVFGLAAAEEAWFDHSLSPLATGFLLGAGLVSVPWIMWTLVLSVDGSASWRIGADAEQWTANELHRLGEAWEITHNVPFPGTRYLQDVDHVAIGPYGVLAVETKWTSATVDLGAKRLPKDIQNAVRQAEANAGRVRGLLSRVAEIDVIPLVVFWGRDVTPATEPVRREGTVRIVAGKQAELWRPRLDAERLEVEMVARLSARVRWWLVEQEEKTFGVVVRNRMRAARRLSFGSIAAMFVVIALFPTTSAWAGLDRFIGAVVRWGGGAVGVVVLLLPVALALAALAYVCLARRLDPTISLLRWTIPLAFCFTAFGALVVITP